MYKIGHRSKKRVKRKLWVFILTILVVICAAIAIGVIYLLNQETEQITMPTKAITREYAPPQEDVKEFHEGPFSITLPKDWVYKGHLEAPHNVYAYQSTKKNEDSRRLEIFIDNIPTEKAFNRILPVTIQEGRLVVSGSVSGNCVEFTGINGVNPQTAGVATLASKWQGVEFTCDVGNRTRNLIGVGTVEHKSNIPLGNHIYYFMYIDHSIHPNYQILEKALESFIAQ